MGFISCEAIGLCDSDEECVQHEDSDVSCELLSCCSSYRCSALDCG